MLDIGGNLFNLSINEDLKAIQKQFPQLSVQGLHDDITILAGQQQQSKRQGLHWLPTTQQQLVTAESIIMSTEYLSVQTAN
jgi:hypothetical protein